MSWRIFHTFETALKNQLNKFHILLWILLTHLAGFSQTVQYTNYNTQNGLPSPETYFVYEDAVGYIWIGTDRGLSRFDGYKFSNFTSANTVFEDNTVFKAYEAPNKDVWFTCFDGSIIIYSPESQLFKPFEFNDSLQKWFKHWPKNITFFNEGAYIYEYLDREKYACWIKSGDEVNMVNLSYQNQKPVSQVFFEDIGEPRMLYLDSMGGDLHLFTGWTRRDTGISKNDRVLFEHTVKAEDRIYFFRDFSLFDLKDSVVSLVKRFDAAIHHIAYDRQNRMLVSTESGFYIKNGNRYVNQLPGVKASYSYQDVEGNYWVSSLNQGVFRIPNLLTMEHIDVEGYEITALHSLENHLLIGAPERIYKYDGIRVPVLLVDRISKEAKSVRVKSFTQNKGMVLSTGPYHFYTRDSQLIVDKLPLNRICKYPLYVGNDYILTASTGEGYYVYNQADSSGAMCQGLNDLVLGFDQDMEDTVWIASRGGVWKVHPHNLRHPFKLTAFDRLSGRINQIAHTSNNTKIFATASKGVFFIKKGKLVEINVSNGLISNVINCIMLESDSILWVGTNKGVSRVKITDQIDQIYVDYSLNMDDGLLTSYIYTMAIWKKKLWLGTDKGIMGLGLSDITRSKTPPRLILEGIQIAQGGVAALGDMVFKHFQNDISIDYVGISFNKPESEFYRYRLLYAGDKDTSYRFTNNTSMDFLNLSPGDYVFEVACRDKNNQWSETRQYTFEIKPHYTDTLWFKGLISMSIVLLFLGIIYWQYREIKRKNAKEAKLKELEYKFKESELAILRNQMNPHFVFNALNSIQSYILQSDPETASGYIQRFSVLMRSSLEYTMDDWISMEKEIAFLSNYLHIEQLRFPERFEFEITHSQDIHPLDINIPPLLVQPIVENCVKHAFEADEKNGLINVHFELGKDEVICTVSDNGVGINHSRTRSKIKHRSYGIEVVKNRLSLLNEEEDVEYMVYVDMSEFGNNQTGTRVTLNIPVE